MPKYCKFFSDCKNRAVYRIPHSNLALCKDHFLSNVEKRVQTLIEKKHMFHPNRDEKLLIALSGGKDSNVLLSIIKKLYPQDLEIEALYVNLDINHDNYSEDSATIAQDLCNKMNIPFHSVNVKDEYGFSIDQIHKLKEEYDIRNLVLEKDPFRGECSYCGAFKRYIINNFASAHSFTSVATGHNLTDETTQLMNNFFNVDLNFLARPGPVVDSNIDKLVKRVKPLFFISEEEITMYAYFSNIKFLSTECHYSIHVPNTQLKQVMIQIEEYRKGNMISLLRRYYKLMQPVLEAAIATEKPQENYCKKCGSPTMAKTCSFCRMINTLQKRFAKISMPNPTVIHD